LEELTQQCIDACQECHTVCLDAVAYCLLMGEEHAKPSHIKALLDCAEICQTSANLMLRGSHLQAITCETCAEACEDCARYCDQFAVDLKMQACADLCRRCSRSCRAMIDTISALGAVSRASTRPAD
jgi:hypothetical protein